MVCRTPLWIVIAECLRAGAQNIRRILNRFALDENLRRQRVAKSMSHCILDFALSKNGFKAERNSLDVVFLGASALPEKIPAVMRGAVGNQKTFESPFHGRIELAAHGDAVLFPMKENLGHLAACF